MADENESSTTIIVTIMGVLVALIESTVTDLPPEDISKLRLIEIRPKSEEFADMKLSCSIQHTGLMADNWDDVEIASPGRAYNLYSGSPYIDNGGNQFFNLRFTVDFTLFFQELRSQVDRDQATISTELMLARIHHRIQNEGWAGGKGMFAPCYQYDSFKSRIINANRAVKKKHISPRGSKHETFYKAKMYLQFEAEYEVDESWQRS